MPMFESVTIIVIMGDVNALLAQLVGTNSNGLNEAYLDILRLLSPVILAHLAAVVTQSMFTAAGDISAYLDYIHTISNGKHDLV